jgi:hypothetical protein
VDAEPTSMDTLIRKSGGCITATQAGEVFNKRCCRDNWLGK